MIMPKCAGRAPEAIASCRPTGQQQCGDPRKHLHKRGQRRSRSSSSPLSNNSVWHRGFASLQGHSHDSPSNQAPRSIPLHRRKPVPTAEVDPGFSPGQREGGHLLNRLNGSEHQSRFRPDWRGHCEEHLCDEAISTDRAPSGLRLLPRGSSPRLAMTIEVDGAT
jgi:hypothetical protein